MLKRKAIIGVIMLAIGCSRLVCCATQSAQAGNSETRRITALVFPFAASESIAPDKAILAAKCAEDLNTQVFAGLSASPRVTPVKFNAGSISIRRAIFEKTLSSVEIPKTIDTTVSGINIAGKCSSTVGSDYAVIGSIDRYDYRPELGRLEIGATLQLIDAGTGKVKNTVSVTSRSLHMPDDDGSEAALCTTAIRKAYDKLIVEFIPSTLGKG